MQVYLGVITSEGVEQVALLVTDEDDVANDALLGVTIKLQPEASESSADALPSAPAAPSPRLEAETEADFTWPFDALK